jgi:hypothetical protein
MRLKMIVKLMAVEKLFMFNDFTFHFKLQGYSAEDGKEFVNVH